MSLRQGERGINRGHRLVVVFEHIHHRRHVRERSQTLRLHIFAKLVTIPHHAETPGVLIIRDFGFVRRARVIGSEQMAKFVCGSEYLRA